MSTIPIPLATGAAATIAVGGVLLGRHLFASRLRAARDSHDRRPALWNRFYAVDWGDTTTNNYGFAPAAEDHPQRFQREMYRQLLHRLEALRGTERPLRLLEVSCGRAGGLEAFLEAGGERFTATGLDVARPAIDYCRAHYRRPGLDFVHGSALDLPFEDGSFDVVLNVEASNDYGDRPRFLSEAARVLRDDGVFLYADTCWETKVDRRIEEFREAGFDAVFDDITANVAEACREDSPRRRAVLERHAPLFAKIAFGPQLENYAAVEGTRKYNAFASAKRRYLMTAATKS